MGDAAHARDAGTRVPIGAAGTRAAANRNDPQKPKVKKGKGSGSNEEEPPVTYAVVDKSAKSRKDGVKPKKKKTEKKPKKPSVPRKMQGQEATPNAYEDVAVDLEEEDEETIMEENELYSGSGGPANRETVMHENEVYEGVEQAAAKPVLPARKQKSGKEGRGKGQGAEAGGSGEGLDVSTLKKYVPGEYLNTAYERDSVIA